MAGREHHRTGHRDRSPSKQLLLAIDVGTTNLKICVFDGSPGAGCALLHGAERGLTILGDGQRSEMDPDELWAQILELMREAVAETAQKGMLMGIGLSCQRNTFISWDRKTLKPCHPLITWKDGRGNQFCERWNESGTRKLLNLAGAFAHFFTRAQRYKAARMFRLLGAMVPPRFLVTLRQNPEMRRLLASGELALGCLDTWLLLKLSGGRLFVTEPSSASSTGMFDPFTADWGHSILRLLRFPDPSTILPPLVETTLLGPGSETDPALFGRPIPICASLGDSQAAAFGTGCVRRGDVKISLGTGTLFDFISGPEVHSTMHGMYPLVGWRLDGKSTHLLEGRANDTASAIQWAQSVGLLPTSLDELDEQHNEEEEEDNGALCFVPAFGGIQTPIGDDNACAALMGITTGTTRRHIARAVLDSIAFGVFQIWTCLVEEVPAARSAVCRIRCCGGVSRNSSICQRIATLIRRPVERVLEPQFSSARGAALLAGIGAGLWTMDQLDMDNDKNGVVECVFRPQHGAIAAALQQRYRRWCQAQQRCMHYHCT